MLATVNMAGEIGRGRLPWWQDWRGETVAVIGSGPSTKQANIDALRGRARVIAIKENVDLAPWADAVYGCDWHWWHYRRGLPDFQRLRITWDTRATDQYPWLRKIEIDVHGDNLLFDEPANVGSGGNSGFHAMNLAAQFGASRIILIGMDMTDRGGAHWYGRNNWAHSANPQESNFIRWRRAFANAASQLNDMGVELVNASPVSHIPGASRRTIEQALEEWEQL